MLGHGVKAGVKTGVKVCTLSTPCGACLQGELMDSIAAWGDAHHARHVLTDLTLALMQDSGWCGADCLLC